MPYINEDKRMVLNEYIDQLINAIRELECDDPSNNTEGNINYIISSILNRVYVDSLNYGSINDVIGVLECVKLEFYRRVATPYEDQKVFDNGDVYNIN